MIDALDYVSVPVEDLSDSVRFYRDVLGLRLQYELPNRWAELAVGQTRLALYPREPEEGRGGDVAFRVDDLDREVSRLQARGVAFPHGIEAFALPNGKGRPPDSGTRAGTGSNSSNVREGSALGASRPSEAVLAKTGES